MEVTIIPDGDYVGRLTALETKESTNGHRYLEWRLVIESGSEEGTPIIKRSFATTPKALEFLQKELSKIGVDAQTAEDLNEKKQAALNKRIRFSVQQGENGMPNIYIQGLIEGEDGLPSKKSLW